MRILVLALVLAVPAMLPLAAPATAPTCATVDGVGFACQRDDGLLDVLAPDGAPLGSVHGTDPAPAPALPAAPLVARPPACVDGIPGDTYVIVIYARAFDDADRYATKLPTIRSLVAQANGLVNDAAMTTGATTADLRILCAAGEVAVKNEVLPTPLAGSSFSTIVTDLRAKSYTDTRVKHWVYFDDTSACTCGGTGHLAYDDRPTLANLNNGVYPAPMFAVDFGYDSVRILLHELGHNMGAVQLTAPHSTGAGHCYDGLDTMCYNDGGPNGSRYTTSACSVEVFDCGHDDYCNAAPPLGSYLSQKWNVCSWNNRFIAMGNDPTR